ncbi:MAG: Gfo/Idh/MocA family protein [Armatimonadota bacterium]
MKDGQLCVAQIGCGSFAAGQDLPNFRDNPRVTCTWCCDVSEAAARTLAAEYGVPNVTTDFLNIMRDPEVDFIKIATSHEVHLPIIEAAARAGKHVFCEKPLAMEEREALLIIRAVRQSGIKLCVDLNRRMSPALNVLKTRWQAHRARPASQPWRYIETDRAPYPDELKTHFLVRVQDDTASYRVVHMDPLRGGGQIIAESVHWLDVSNWLFAPQIPVQIQAWGSTRFSHGIHITYSEGDTATVLFHCGGTFDYPKELYEITCQGGLFRSENFVENSYYGVPGLDRELFPLLRDSNPEIGTEGGMAGYMAKYHARVHGLLNAKQGHNTLMMDKGWSQMLDGFITAILEDTPSPCDEMAGHLSTYLAKLAIQSIETRNVLPVPLEKVVFTVL